MTVIDAPHNPDDDDTGVPVQTDNGPRDFDPVQDVSQDPNVDYSEGSL